MMERRNSQFGLHQYNWHSAGEMVRGSCGLQRYARLWLFRVNKPTTYGHMNKHNCSIADDP